MWESTAPPVFLLAMVLWWGLSFWIAWRFMRAHERIADAATMIAIKCRGVSDKPTEPFVFPGDAEESKP